MGTHRNSRELIGSARRATRGKISKPEGKFRKSENNKKKKKKKKKKKRENIEALYERLKSPLDPRPYCA